MIRNMPHNAAARAGLVALEQDGGYFVVDIDSVHGLIPLAWYKTTDEVVEFCDWWQGLPSMSEVARQVFDDLGM